jgi:predicted DNA-binding transcriptional regulator AlpA
MTVDPDETRMREMVTTGEVLAKVPFSRTTIFRLEREGLFPKSIRISPHRKAYFQDEVVSWQRELADPDSGLSKKLEAFFESDKGKDE